MPSDRTARRADNDDEVPGLLPDPAEIEETFDRLWPIMRSITGDGVRETHDILGEIVPLTRHEVPSGTKVLDWQVPPEWVCLGATLTGPDGKTVVDVRDHTLHLVNYSAPFHGAVSRQELEAHLYSLPDLPDAIPYVTSYYTPRWGFCLTDTQRHALPDGDYQVAIDTAFKEDGSLTYSEAVLPGDTAEEVLFSTYTCHPSMANNELSGPLVAAYLYRHPAALPRRRLTYRFVFTPETIGAIAYLDRDGARLKQALAAGYVLTCVGNPARLTRKGSRQGDSLADRAAAAAWAHREGTRLIDFYPSGSDERQYCSPGFDLPVCSISRTLPAEYGTYHTSLDNRDFISFETLADSVAAMTEVVRVLETNRTYNSLFPYGEPRLGPRGLVHTLGAGRDARQRMEAVQWFLNLADGQHDLIAMAERSGLPFAQLEAVTGPCLEAGLVEVVG